jgi:predicted tellurium resistance membrane protein TerC
MNLFTADNLISLIVLVVLEIVLGIDNVIFVSIILNRLPQELRKRGRIIWMFTGIGVRSILLFGLQWLLQQKGKSIFTIWGKGFDIASLVMIAGGIFLIYKTVMEIHHKLEGEEEHTSAKKSQLTLGKAVVQIILIDMVFSFDSIITAGGTAKVLAVMIIAVVIAMIVMFLFSGKIANFIQKHPTIKMLALSFLVMIGFILLVEGFDGQRAEELHLKNYAYFAMAFSFLVELLNMKLRKQSDPVKLKDSGEDDETK